MFGKKEEEINEVPTDSGISLETKQCIINFSNMKPYKAKEFYEKVKKAVTDGLKCVELGDEFIDISGFLRLSLEQPSDDYDIEVIDRSEPQ